MLLAAEKEYLGYIDQMIDGLKNEGALSTAAENFLQGIADKHSSHVYLLQQRSK
jgi:hypothetical protein